MDTKKPTFLQAFAIICCGALMIFVLLVRWLTRSDTTSISLNAPPQARVDERDKE